MIVLFSEFSAIVPITNLIAKYKMISSISFELQDEDGPRDFFRSRVTFQTNTNRSIRLVSEYNYIAFSYCSGSLGQCYLTNLVLVGSRLLFPVRDCWRCRNPVFFVLGFSCSSQIMFNQMLSNDSYLAYKNMYVTETFSSNA